VVWPQFLIHSFNLLVAVSQKLSALLSDSWAFCLSVCDARCR